MKLRLLKLFLNITWLIILIHEIESLASSSFSIPKFVQNGYIVQFKTVFTRRFEERQFHIFYEQLLSTRAIVRPRLNLTSRFFQGVSFNLLNSESLRAIEKHDAVKNIWQIRVYSLPQVSTEGTFNLAKDFNSRKSRNERTPLPSDIMTGVDQLHNHGHHGEGVKIAILDTGIDYLHPDLGGGFGPGYKFSFGYDLIGDKYDGIMRPEPDDDPFEECGVHGTHVSGTIGAQGDLFTGVATRATLGMYRVFSCAERTTSDILMQAYIMAATENAHIITASLGIDIGWNDDPLSLIVNQISSSGITCLVAAGNSGAAGPFYGSAPAGALSAIAVASVNSISTVLVTFEGQYKVENSTYNFTYMIRLQENINIISDSYIISTNALSENHIDACSTLPSLNHSNYDYILLIRFGKCDWKVQNYHLQVAMIHKVIFFGAENLSFVSEPASILYAIIEQNVADIWLTELKKGKSIKVHTYDIGVKNVVYEYNGYDGGLISSFSSWYPTNNLQFKPDLAAPGGKILSTVPRKFGGYGLLSGTSMATPYVAGIAALYLGGKVLPQNKTGDMLKNILISTATPLNYSYNLSSHPYLAPTAQQGVGLVNASAVFYSTTEVSATTFSLNDTENLKNELTLLLTNTANVTITYKLSHRDAGTFYVLRLLRNGNYDNNDFSSLLLEYATVYIFPLTITLTPGSMTIILIKVSPPDSVESDLLPVYSGFIKIDGDSGETYHIGYMGVACSMKTLDLNDTLISDVSFGYEDTSTGEVIAVSEDEIIDFRWMTLRLTARHLLGSRLVRLDILGSRANLIAGGVKIVDSLPGYPIHDIPRIPVDILMLQGWNGTLKSNTKIRPGTYNLLLRFLKIFGDPEQASDYYMWRSVTFLIV